jgi:hypothetical protein
LRAVRRGWSVETSRFHRVLIVDRCPPSSWPRRASGRSCRSTPRSAWCGCAGSRGRTPTRTTWRASPQRHVAPCTFIKEGLGVWPVMLIAWRPCLQLESLGRSADGQAAGTTGRGALWWACVLAVVAGAAAAGIMARQHWAMVQVRVGAQAAQWSRHAQGMYGGVVG